MPYNVPVAAPPTPVFCAADVPTAMNRRMAVLAGAQGVVWPVIASSAEGQVAAQEVAIGSIFEVISTLYWHKFALDLNKKSVDRVVLLPLRLSGPEILARHLVPLGSQIRIIAKLPSRWPSFMFAPEYQVEVSTMSARAGIPVVLALSRGNEGAATPLNPTIYKPL